MHYFGVAGIVGNKSKLIINGKHTGIRRTDAAADTGFQRQVPQTTMVSVLLRNVGAIRILWNAGYANRVYGEGAAAA